MQLKILNWYEKIEIKIYNLIRLIFKKCPPSRFLVKEIK